MQTKLSDIQDTASIIKFLVTDGWWLIGQMPLEEWWLHNAVKYKVSQLEAS